MRRLTKFLLALAVVSSAVAVLALTGIIDASRMPGLYCTFPLGAICLGMFLISHALETQMAADDAGQTAGAKSGKVIHYGQPGSPQESDRPEARWDQAA